MKNTCLLATLAGYGQPPLTRARTLDRIVRRLMDAVLDDEGEHYELKKMR